MLMLVAGHALMFRGTQETFRTRALTTNATLYFRGVYFEATARARSVLAYFVSCCFYFDHATKWAQSAYIFVISISILVLQKLAIALYILTQRLSKYIIFFTFIC